MPRRSKYRKTSRTIGINTDTGEKTSRLLIKDIKTGSLFGIGKNHFSFIKYNKKGGKRVNKAGSKNIRIRRK